MPHAVADVTLHQPVYRAEVLEFTVDYTLAFRSAPPDVPHEVRVELWANELPGESTVPPAIEAALGKPLHTFVFARRGGDPQPSKHVTPVGGRVTDTVRATVPRTVADEDPGHDPRFDVLIGAPDEVYAKVLVDGEVAGVSPYVGFRAFLVVQ